MVAVIGLSCAPIFARGDAYDLSKVRGIETFNGSTAAKELLRRNGFVVSDPAFKQIFEPYITNPQTGEPSEKNPLGSSLPSFITTDSAWHTYHVLLEEGVKQMEEVQSRRLLDFSRQLLKVLSDPKLASNELAWLPSIGLGLQDEKYRQTLSPDATRIVTGLRTGSEMVVVPVGFPLSPLQFRAQSFYTQSPELSDYFAARQWYASAVFRLAEKHETKSALRLAALINGNPDLLALWQQLSDPFDHFLAAAEDGTIRQYSTAAQTIAGMTNGNDSMQDGQFARVQAELERQLPLPQINDQLLSPEQYAEFAKQIRGFRVLPPRRLPCAICFQNTTAPKISGRTHPSGLDFLVASPALRSPAALRAVQGQFGKGIADLIVKTECGPLPDSVHGEAMQLLGTLQTPLPNQVPAPLRTEAWSDLQLWSQLGAWAEQRHTWALHTKLNVSVMGIVTPPVGMVSPYPEFFSGLANLTRRTAATFEKAGLEQLFEAKQVASDLVELLDLSQRLANERDYRALEKNSGKLEQLGQFQNRYYEKHQAELEKNGSRDGWKRLQSEVEALARRCAASGAATEAETDTLRLFFDSRQSIARMLNDFAPVCDRLAQLATKSLKGEPLTEADGEWIKNYGITLAGFHFYYGNSYEVPRDDFPIVTRVFSSPITGTMLYAGLARPQALYVIVPKGKTLELHRGAVMTYREFVRPNDQLLDDDSWRELIAKGQTPPAPPFTRSFYAETSVGELLQRLNAVGQKEESNFGDIDDILWQIGSRATEKDLPALFEMLTHTKGEGGRWDIVDGLAEIIGRLPWESRRQEMIELLASPDKMLGKAVARIFIAQPASVDAARLTAGFTRQPTHTRRLYCAILGRQPQPTDATKKLLLQALHDPAAGVRWQAVIAIGQVGWSDPQSHTALLHALSDTNQFVGAAAAHSLAKLHVTNAASLLFTKFKATLEAAKSPPVDVQQQSLEITQEFRGEENHAVSVLDPERLETRLYVNPEVTANFQRIAAMRLPPRPFPLPDHNYGLVIALIEALGDLGYMPVTDELIKLRGGDYDMATTRALGKIAPERLTTSLLGVATDKQNDSYLREQALVTLCNLSATNHLRDLIPLLDDVTPIVYSRSIPGPEWRICDRAAVSIATLLGWQDRMTPMFVPPAQRDATMQRVREWASQMR